MIESEKIKNGLIIKNKVHLLLQEVVYNSFNHTGREVQEAKEQIKKLWEKCPHKYEWIDTNPYNEVCECIYCGADSPRTRNF